MVNGRRRWPEIEGRQLTESRSHPRSAADQGKTIEYSILN